MDNVSALVTTHFTEKHESIADKFKGRLVAMLQGESLETETYGIDLKAYNGEQEMIKLNLGDKVQIEIKVTTRRT